MADKFRGPRPISFFMGHEGKVTALHFVNGTDDTISVPSLVSGSDIGEIFIWNLETERTYHRFRGHDKKMILYLYYYKSLLSQGRDGNIHVWKLTNDEWSIINTIKSTVYGFCASILFPSELVTYLVVPTDDCSSLTFYDYEKSKVLYKYTHETESSSANGEMCICIKIFIKDARIFLLMGYDSGYISLWDCEENKEASRLACHPEVILCLDYDSTYANRGISGSVDKTIQVWRKTEDNQLLKVREVTITNPGINAVKIRNDGKIVITGGQDGYLRIFSWKNMKPLSVLCVHQKPVVSLQFRSERFEKKKALILASGSQDKNVCLVGVYF